MSLIIREYGEGDNQKSCYRDSSAPPLRPLRLCGLQKVDSSAESQ